MFMKIPKNVKIILSGPIMQYEVLVISFDGRIIAKKKILSAYTQFCVCTTACKFKLVATCGNQTITKCATVQNCPCPTVFKTFEFALPTPSLPMQKFFLTDLHYGLPVQHAILNFKQ